MMQLHGTRPIGSLVVGGPRPARRRAAPARHMHRPAQPAPLLAAQATRAFAAPPPRASAAPDSIESLEAVLTNGTGVARRVLSDPGIEGDPLAFLRATEAYWKVGAAADAYAALILT